MVDKATRATGHRAQQTGQAKRGASRHGGQPASVASPRGLAYNFRGKKQRFSDACDRSDPPTVQRPKMLESGKPFESYFHQLSHELRTPLNHINGFAEILLLNNDLDECQADYVRCILEASTELQAAVLSHLARVGEA